jgi:hypothetical protein
VLFSLRVGHGVWPTWVYNTPDSEGYYMITCPMNMKPSLGELRKGLGLRLGQDAGLSCDWPAFRLTYRPVQALPIWLVWQHQQSLSPLIICHIHKNTGTAPNCTVFPIVHYYRPGPIPYIVHYFRPGPIPYIVHYYRPGPIPYIVHYFRPEQLFHI